jgi:hypothetical protein
MIIVDCEQRTPEWYAAKNGIPSTSMFANIITPSGKPSESSGEYIKQLVAEWLAGKPVDAFRGNKYTEEGKLREPAGEALYEFDSGNMLGRVGFIYRNEEKLVGSSTDGLIAEYDGGPYRGVFEQKNPKAATMVGYLTMEDMPSLYKPQVQGELWVTDLDWCDFMVYHPDIGHKIWRVHRDEQYITLMSGYVRKFIDRMLKKREQLKHYKR